MEAINGQASLVSQPGVNETVQSAQRMQAVAEIKQEHQAERKRDEFISTVVKNEEAQQKQIRDDDPRQQRQRRKFVKDGRPKEDEPAPSIDIVI